MVLRTDDLSARARQFGRLLSSEGPAGLLRRARRRLADKLMPHDTELEISNADFASAAALVAAGWRLRAPRPWAGGGPLDVAWVCSPPTPGSGGHTTLFRMVRAFQDAGHRCTVYLLDPHEGELSRHIRRMREGWPELEVEVRDYRSGVHDCHAIFATGWQSAWALLGSDAKGLRCYLVQDFEPSFYPAGSEYLLAEATYRFGFKGITAGAWLAGLLRERYGMEAVAFDFGCDLAQYRATTPGSARVGVCYYCRPSTPRRAHDVALAGLRLFARARPEVPIHFYGERIPDPDFPVTQHGSLTPAGLNDLYNQCVAGVVLSATNVSLVPHEMLAAGCIPVVNDADHNRIVLDNDEVAYCGATPYELDVTLRRLMDRREEEKQETVAAAAASVSSRSWADAGRRVVDAVSDYVARASTQSQSG